MYMHRSDQTPLIRRILDGQLAAASCAQIVQYADRAEDLLAQVKPEGRYWMSDLLRQITGAQRSGHAGEAAISGRDLGPDLCRFIEDATKAAPLGVEAASEAVLNTRELAHKLNVSTKTIFRWRQQGLVSRWFLWRGRPRIGFLASSVERFVAANPQRVRFGSGFSQMTRQERETILQQAREMSESGCWPAEAVKRLARLTGRSVETIRLTLRRHDRQHPSSAIFPDHYGPVRSETRQKIYQFYRRGYSVEALSKRFFQTKCSVRQIIAQVRAQRVLKLPLDYIPSEEFAQDLPAKLEREILAPMPGSDRPGKKTRVPKGLPSYLESLYEIPLLTREQEVHLFRRMNYLKYKASQLRSRLDPQRPQKGLMDRIEALYNDSVATKNQILQANLRLVVSIAKRHILPTLSFFDLVSDGNISLIRAVEKFDYSRGNKLSTYATWAIEKNYARTIPVELRHRDRFRTCLGELSDAARDAHTDPQEQEAAQAQRESQVVQLLKHLDRREQEIIVSRFGLDHSRQPQTLKEIGIARGVSKERIRQLETRALDRLRAAADEEHIAFSV